ncbi:MAG: T9SS type A sorting domain-containing protein [Rhodothermales bacterium]
MKTRVTILLLAIAALTIPTTFAQTLVKDIWVGGESSAPKEFAWMDGQMYFAGDNEGIIGFDLPASSYVRLTVFDMVGAEVAVLVDGMQAAGRHTVTFHAEDLPSGTYVYRLMTDTQSLTKTLTYLK